MVSDEAVVADHDAVAFALGAEHRGREPVVGNARRQPHDRIERAREIEADLRRVGLQRRGKGPVG